MSAETELYAALSGFPGLAALIGDRIFPDSIPENTALPTIVFIRGNTVYTRSIGGVLLCEEVSFPITVWDETRTGADLVADQLALALGATQNPALGRSSGFDTEVGLHAVTIETDWLFTP